MQRYKRCKSDGLKDAGVEGTVGTRNAGRSSGFLPFALLRKFRDSAGPESGSELTDPNWLPHVSARTIAHHDLAGRDSLYLVRRECSSAGHGPVAVGLEYKDPDEASGVCPFIHYLQIFLWLPEKDSNLH